MQNTLVVSYPLVWDDRPRTILIIMILMMPTLIEILTTVQTSDKSNLYQFMACSRNTVKAPKKISCKIRPRPRTVILSINDQPINQSHTHTHINTTIILLKLISYILNQPTWSGGVSIINSPVSSIISCFTRGKLWVRGSPSITGVVMKEDTGRVGEGGEGGVAGDWGGRGQRSHNICKGDWHVEQHCSSLTW